MARTASTLFGSLVSLSMVLATAACGSSSSRGSFDGAPAGDGSGSDDGPPASGSELPPPAPDKPGCAQTAYSETLPSKASLSDLTFSSSGAQTYMLSALDRRYPIGKFVLQGGLSSPLTQQQGSCFDRFLQDKSSADSVLQQAETVVHECGHFFDLGQSSGSDHTYVFRPDLKLTCKNGDTTTRGGKTFARSRLRSDAFYDKRPACNNQPSLGCDTYADIYLDGSDTDGTFQSGDQGYDSVLEEATQYINSLAIAAGSTSMPRRAWTRSASTTRRSSLSSKTARSASSAQPGPASRGVDASRIAASPMGVEASETGVTPPPS